MYRLSKFVRGLGFNAKKHSVWLLALLAIPLMSTAEMDNSAVPEDQAIESQATASEATLPEDSASPQENVTNATEANESQSAETQSVESEVVESSEGKMQDEPANEAQLSDTQVPEVSNTDESFIADDHQFQCQLSGESRVVEVDYADQGGLPCTVYYQKQGETQELWKAKNQIDYCAQKAQSFIAKLESYGWICELAQPDSAKLADPAPEVTAASNN